MRELVEAHQVVAVGAHRVALGGREVADRVRHGGLVDHFPRAELPLGDGAVDEQRRVGPAVGAELRVQRPEADGDLGVLDRFVLEHRDAVLVTREVLVADGGLHLLEIEGRGHALQFARADDPLAVGRHVHAVRRLAAGHEVHEPGHLAGVNHLDAADHLALPLGHGLLDGAPVDDGDIVAVALRGGDLKLAGGALGVVRGEEHEPVRGELAGVAEVVVERRHQQLPGERHLTALRVDLHPGDDALVLGGVLVDAHGALRHRAREARRHHRVLGVGRHERRGVVAVQVGHRAQDLLGLEVAQVDARQPAVHLVDEEPAAVVVALGLRERRMVRVAPRELAQHLLGIVIETVPRGGVGREDRNGGQMPHRREAVDVHLPGVAARREHVVLVQVARRHVGLLRGHGQVRLGAAARGAARFGRAGRALAGREYGEREQPAP